MIVDLLVSPLKDEVNSKEVLDIHSKVLLKQQEVKVIKEESYVSNEKSRPNLLSEPGLMTHNCAGVVKDIFNVSLRDENFQLSSIVGNFSFPNSDLRPNITNQIDLRPFSDPNIDPLCSNDSLSNFSFHNIAAEYPDELRNVNMTQLISYAVLFPLAAIGNLLVFVALFRNRHRKSRVNLMLLHLSLADMIVTFIFLPTEIVWHIHIEWIFGNIGCKVYKYLSAFGFYISSMVLVCISLDRYFAVLHPLKVNDAQRRGKIMLMFAWLIAAVISIPQCVTFGFFDANQEMVYTAFVISFLYFIPLTIIVIAYSRIIVEITKKSRETKCDSSGNPSSSSTASGDRRHFRLRRSNVSTIERARARTLGMTFIIVMAFVWCWTPYSICTLWNFIDQDTFKRMNLHLQDILFILAVSNSVVNPIIYGRYSLTCCRKKKLSPRSTPVCTGSCYFCYFFCCCCLSSAVMEHDNKLCHVSGLTRSTASLNPRSARFTHCRYLVNGLSKPTVPQVQIGRDTVKRPEALQDREIMSMVHLGLRNSSGGHSQEFELKVLGEVPKSGETNNSPIILRSGALPSATIDPEASSGYASTQGHCHSFQEIHDKSRHFTVWKTPNSC